MKTFDKRDRAIKDACKTIGAHAVEGIHYKLVKEGKRTGWESLEAPAETPSTTLSGAPVTSPGMARLAASKKAESIRQDVLADQKKAEAEAASRPFHEFKEKDRVYDVANDKVIGTVFKAGKQVSEIKWDQKEPWGKTSNTLNANLRLVDDIPDGLKVANRKALTPAQKAKLDAASKKNAVTEKHDLKLPRSVDAAGLAILEGQKNAKAGKGEKPVSDVTATKGNKREKASWPPTAKITILKTENPKRPGSGAEKFYAMYKPNMLVSKYLEMVGPRGPFLIKYDSAHGFIKVVE